MTLSVDERRILTEISYQIGDGKAHSIKDTRGAAVSKHLISEYMRRFVQEKYYTQDGKKFTITKLGKFEFEKQRNIDSRRVS